MSAMGGVFRVYLGGMAREMGLETRSVLDRSNQSVINR